MWTIGIDTGGTFTDLFASSDAGEVLRGKVPSTPPDFSRGIIEGIRDLGIPPAEIRLVLHGTTVTTNAAITKSGARTALVTTKGFRDVLELRRGNREDLYDILWDPPDALIGRRDRLEVAERVDYRGRVTTPLDEDDVREVAQTLLRRGVEAVAVCFINAFVNPDHERRVRDILQAALPDSYVCISSDILREPPEFERTATVATNAFVAPVLRRYLENLQRALVEEVGYEGDLLLMHSGGGLMTAEAARDIPARTITSGPAAGAMAAAAIGATCGRENVISLDIGGTSADIAVIHEGAARVKNEYEVEWGLPVQFPAIDLVTVGAGGGSIAWLDTAGYPRSGPMSAGADPGPACYGRGGTRPTNTDANLVLGRLGASAALGGKVTIDPELAARAIEEQIAGPLGLGAAEAADGILRVSNATMARAIRRMTIEAGFDPREFSLVAFGGAGPLHAVDLAQELQIDEVIVPPAPGVTSALGLLVVDLVHDFSQSIIQRQESVDLEELETAYRALEAEARERLEHEGIPEQDMTLTRELDLRYVGQVRSLAVQLDPGPLDAAALAGILERFHATHRREYRYAIPDAPVETYILRVAARGALPKPRFAASRGEPDGDPRKGERPVYFREVGEFVPTTIYERDRLTPGAVLEGPAVVEQLDSTTVVPPGMRATVDAHLNLIIQLGGDRSGTDDRARVAAAAPVAQ